MLDLKCYNTNYSTMGRDSSGKWNEYVSEEEYREVMNEEGETFTDLFHQAIDELLENEAKEISRFTNRIKS